MHAYPRGWFAVAPSTAVTTTATTVHFFGRDIVLFRGESGRAYAVDPHCPHLGAHLGGGGESRLTRRSEKHDLIAKVQPHNWRPDEVEFMKQQRAAGKVVGEEIACPFHGWRFNGATGACAGVPYSEKCPEVKLATWPIEERDGWVHVWHHVWTQETAEAALDAGLAKLPPIDNGGEWDRAARNARKKQMQSGKPYADVRLPQWPFPAVDDHADWTPLRDAVYTFPAHFLDIFENAADPVHFNVVHGSRNACASRSYEINGVTWRSWAAFEAPVHGLRGNKCPLCHGITIRTSEGDHRLHAPPPRCEHCNDAGVITDFVFVESHFQLTGVGHICVRSKVPQFGIKMRNFFYATPVDEKTVQVVARSQVHKSAPPEVEALYYAATLRDFEADAAVWEHKVRLERPVLVPEDGPIREYRKWAAQFYE